MTDSLVKKENAPVAPAPTGLPDLFAAWTRTNPFFEFRHTTVSITLSEGTTHVKARENRFLNGRMESEQFEGTAGQELFENAARKMISAYADAFSQMLDTFARFNPFLPFAPRSERIDRS